VDILFSVKLTTMKILHTSDWHLGRSLYGRKRYAEFEAFLNWLLNTIKEESVEILLVAGDIFDTTTPGNRAQQLYYRFLCQVAGAGCRHVVIVAGNHDSPSFLSAPKELLKALNVQVVGTLPDDPAEEVFLLENKGQPEALVCGVPYLRDRDLRTGEPGESIDDKNAKLVEGLKNHYELVFEIAQERQSQWEGAGGEKIPILGMGHLFTSGGKTVEGDGVRELYVGSLAHVGRDIFPSGFDYLALGHLHVPQVVGGAEHIRYSGSPLPMGFGEVGQGKKVILVEFSQGLRVIRELPVPTFQELQRLEGTLEEILQGIEQLKKSNSTAWLEIEYSGVEVRSNLREQLEEAISDTDMEIRRVKNRTVMNRIIHSLEEEETLDELTVEEVFQRCLKASEVPPEDQPNLLEAYREIVRDLYEADGRAE